MILPSGAELPKSLTDHGNYGSCWVDSCIWMVGGYTPFLSQTMDLAWHRCIDDLCSPWGKHWMKTLPILSEWSGSHAREHLRGCCANLEGELAWDCMMSFRLQNLRWIIRWVSLNDLVPPYLMMYDTTMALSHIRHTTRDQVEAGTLLLSGALPPSLIDWWAGLPTAWTTSLVSNALSEIPAALQGRVTKPPDGEWSGSLKSCLTRTLSPDTKPLMPITGLCGVRADLSALGLP